MEHFPTAGANAWNGRIYNFDMEFGFASKKILRVPPTKVGLPQMLKKNLENVQNKGIQYKKKAS